MFDAFGNNVGGYLTFQCAADHDRMEEWYIGYTDPCPLPAAKEIARMQTGGFNWRGSEGSITDRVLGDMEHEDGGRPAHWSAYTRPSTGLIYMQARYYEPETGRFTQADPMPYGLMQLANGQNNRWTYCGNDPVNLSDPSGMEMTLVGGLILLVIIITIILLLLAAVQWLMNLCGLSKTPRRCLNYDTGEYTNDEEMLRFLQGVGVLSEIPGCTHTGPPTPATNTPGVITQLVNWFWGLF